MATLQKRADSTTAPTNRGKRNPQPVTRKAQFQGSIATRREREAKRGQR